MWLTKDSGRSCLQSCEHLENKYLLLKYTSHVCGKTWNGLVKIEAHNFKDDYTTYLQLEHSIISLSVIKILASLLFVNHYIKDHNSVSSKKQFKVGRCAECFYRL